MPGFRFSPPSPQLGSKLPALPGHRMEAALPPRSAAQRNGGRAPRGGSAALPQPPASCPPPPLRPPRHGAGKGDRGGREELERHHYAPRAQARRSCAPRQRYEPLRCRGGGEGGRSPPPSGRAAPLPPRGGYYLHFVSPPHQHGAQRKGGRGKVTWRESRLAAARGKSETAAARAAAVSTFFPPPLPHPRGRQSRAARGEGPSRPNGGSTRERGPAEEGRRGEGKRVQ